MQHSILFRRFILFLLLLTPAWSLLSPSPIDAGEVRTHLERRQSVSTLPPPFGNRESGTSFRIEATTSPIQKISLRSGAAIDQIQLYYQDGTASGVVGGTGGTAKEFSLEENETIFGVYIWWSRKRIEGMQFATTTGRLSEKFGSTRGTLAPVFPASRYKGELMSLRGFYGVQGSFIMGITPLFDSAPEGTRLAEGVPFGIPAGDEFSDLTKLGNRPSGRAITRILVWTATQDGVVRIAGIQCLWDDGTKGEIHGRQTPDERGFTFGRNERAMQVNMRVGWVISSLQVVAESPGKSPIWFPAIGGTHGVERTWSAPNMEVDGQEDARFFLLGFKGRVDASGWINELAPIWAHNVPIAYLMYVDTVDFKDVPLEEHIMYARDSFTIDSVDSVYATMSLRWEWTDERVSEMLMDKDSQERVPRPFLAAQQVINVARHNKDGAKAKGLFHTGDVHWVNDGQVIMRKEDTNRTLDRQAMMKPGSDRLTHTGSYIRTITPINSTWTGFLYTIFTNNYVTLAIPIKGMFRGLTDGDNLQSTVLALPN